MNWQKGKHYARTHLFAKRFGEVPVGLQRHLIGHFRGGWVHGESLASITWAPQGALGSSRQRQACVLCELADLPIASYRHHHAPGPS